MLPERIELDEEVLLVECIDWRSLEEYSITIVLLVVEEMVELVENDDGLALLVDTVNEMDETDETEVLDEIFKYISERIVIDEQFFVQKENEDAEVLLVLCDIDDSDDVIDVTEKKVV